MNLPPSLPTAAMPPGPPPRAPGWWQRHWKWAMPLLFGGLGLLFAGAIGLFAYGLFSVMGSSDVATEAKRRALGDPRVIEALGPPVEPGWFIRGNLQANGPRGEASLQIPLEGAKTGGDLYLEAQKRAGRWHYSALLVVVDGQATDIDLRTQEEIAARTAPDDDAALEIADERP